MYCTPADVYRYGPPPGGLANPARAVEVDASSDLVTLDQHGLETDDELTFRAEAGGSLPAGLSAGTTYYAVVTSDATFKVAATAGGVAINLTTAGSNVVLVTRLPIERLIAFESALLNEQLPQHVVPLTAPYPESVRGVVAMRVAALLMQRTRSGSLDEIQALRAEAQRTLDRWLTRPIRGAVVPPAASLAAVATAAQLDTRGWGPSDGRLP